MLDRTDTVTRIADGVVAAVAAGDEQTLRELYDPDMVMVLHTDGTERNRDQAVAAFLALRDGLRDVDLEITDRQHTETGYVSQQVLHCTTAAGERVHVPHCLIVRIRDGRITRIDEYLDTARLAPLLAAGTAN